MCTHQYVFIVYLWMRHQRNNWNNQYSSKVFERAPLCYQIYHHCFSQTKSMGDWAPYEPCHQLEAKILLTARVHGGCALHLLMISMMDCVVTCPSQLHVFHLCFRCPPPVSCIVVMFCTAGFWTYIELFLVLLFPSPPFYIHILLFFWVSCVCFILSRTELRVLVFVE